MEIVGLSRLGLLGCGTLKERNKSHCLGPRMIPLRIIGRFCEAPTPPCRGHQSIFPSSREAPSTSIGLCLRGGRQGSGSPRALRLENALTGIEEADS